jgi:hypothetical protein
LSVSGANNFFPEFWPREKEKNNLNNRNKKTPFDQKLAHFKFSWAQKTGECVSFWAQKLTLWARATILKDK